MDYSQTQYHINTNWRYHVLRFMGYLNESAQKKGASKTHPIYRSNIAMEMPIGLLPLIIGFHT